MKITYYYNPQGTELEKNMLGFYNGEKLNFHGIMQYKKSFASAYGLDKKTDKEKLHWFQQHEHNLQSMQYTAKEPHTFNALLLGWNQHLAGQEVTVPIEIDSTNSQMQMVSILTKNKKMAETCNVCNITDKDGEVQLADMYDILANSISDAMAASKVNV